MTGARRRATFLLFWLIVVEGQAQSVQDVTAPPEPASASAWFSAGNEAFAREDYRSALNAFQAAIAAGSDGPAAPYNAAVSLYRLGEFAAAERAFRELGAAYPEMRSIADYNLGLALVRQGDTDSARTAFLQTAEADDAELAALALAMLERLPAQRRWEADADPIRLVDLGFGYDDNVALIDPLALPAGESADSPFAEFLFYADGAIARRWQLAGTAYAVQYPDADAFDQMVYELSVPYAAQWPRWSLRVSPRVSRSYIGGDGFEQSFGAGLALERRLAQAGSAVGIEMSYDTTDELEPEFAYIDGNRMYVGLRFDRALERARMSFDIRHEQHDRAGPGVSAERMRYRWRLRRPFGAVWSGDLQLEFRDTVYDRLVPERSEDRSQLSLSAGRALRADWWLALRYSYADNDASDPLYGYQRHRISAGFSRRFGESG